MFELEETWTEFCPTSLSGCSAHSILWISQLFSTDEFGNQPCCRPEVRTRRSGELSGGWVAGSRKHMPAEPVDGVQGCGPSSPVCNRSLPPTRHPIRARFAAGACEQTCIQGFRWREPGLVAVFRMSAACDAGQKKFSKNFLQVYNQSLYTTVVVVVNGCPGLWTNRLTPEKSLVYRSHKAVHHWRVNAA